MIPAFVVCAQGSRPPLIERMARICWEAIVTDVRPIALVFDRLQAVVTRFAKAPQGAGAEGVPTAAMRREMIRYGRSRDAALFFAKPTERLDLKLMTSPLFP